MNTKILYVTFSVLFISCGIEAFADVSPEKGKTIFATRCASCHNVNAQLVGPALANIDQKRTVEWLVSFIRSPKLLIAKKDKDAVALYNQFNQVIMPDHEDLTADDVKNVLAYVKAETKTTLEEKAPFARPEKIMPAYKPLYFEKNYGFFISYFIAVFVLVVVLVFAVYVKDIQRKSAK